MSTDTATTIDLLAANGFIPGDQADKIEPGTGVAEWLSRFDAFRIEDDGAITIAWLYNDHATTIEFCTGRGFKTTAVQITGFPPLSLEMLRRVVAS